MNENIDVTFVTEPTGTYSSLYNSFSNMADGVSGGDADSSAIFDEDSMETSIPCTVGGKTYNYIPFGSDNLLPYHIISHIGRSSVLSENKLFNILACYGMGLHYNDIETKAPTTDPAIRQFMMHSSMQKFFLEQATDIKYFYFAVCAVVLNRAGNRILAVRHKEACHCRFEKAKNGKIEHVLYANWRNSISPDSVEVLPLLDLTDPQGDLQERMGLDARDGGMKQRGMPKTKDRVFAVVTRFPTPGCQYYPVPYYTALFRDGWYDISRLIAIGKKSKLRNHASIPYLVEVAEKYWENLFRTENITDPTKKRERMIEEKNNIKNFISGIKNSGKLWVSGFYTTPDGKEVHLVKITRIDTSKDGGDYSGDIAESNNIMCYADNVHPNLVGATPGTGQMNNSGSDKRELFTLKQSLETAFHNLMATVHWIMIYFNKWDDLVYPDVPLLMLTTLDENKDAKQVSTNIQGNEDTNK